MMIGPETYYELELKGRSADGIAKKIRGLKNEIGRLKKEIERQKCTGSFSLIKPDESTRLSCAREYLAEAVKAYEAAGGTYVPGKAEQRAAAFDAALPSVTRIDLSVGGFFGGYENRTVVLNGESVEWYAGHSFRPEKEERTEPGEESPETAEEFLEELREVHMGEWRKNYDSSDYGVHILDGTQWEAAVQYADGRKKEFSGNNAYPFSFDKFRELMGCTEEEEEE